MKMKYLLIAAVATLVWLPSLALAQEKGATKLMKLQTSEDLQQVEAGDSIVMSCPKCKDTYSSVVSKPMKGMKSEEMQTMMKHMCPTCTTSIQTEGAGKNATDKLVHTCNACGSTEVSCCLMKKNGGKTEGM